MFKALISDTKAWKSSIEAIASLIDEGTLQIAKTGLKLRAMDPSQIALVDFKMPESSFEKYEVEKETSIDLDFAELSKITKRARAEDKIELSLDKKFTMNFVGETKRRFNLGIIESTTQAPKEPSIEFTAEIKIGANVLKEALKDSELVSNHISISADEGFTIKAEGDTGSVDIEIPKESIMSIDVKEKARAVFSLDQLDSLLRAADQGSIIMLKLRSDAPLKLEYAIGEGRVIYYLAPRIES